MKTYSFFDKVANAFGTLFRIMSLGMLTLPALFGQATPEANASLPPYGSSSLSNQSRQVIINGVRLSDEQIRFLEQQYRVPIQDGAVERKIE